MLDVQSEVLTWDEKDLRQRQGYLQALDDMLELSVEEN